MTTRRPTKRLKTTFEIGSGQAQVIEAPRQLAHVLWVASRGELGRRNAAIIWMLFGSGCRINEVAQLRVRDVYYPTGELKRSFTMPADYTKTGKSRIVYIFATQHRAALEALRRERIEQRAMLSGDGSFGGLDGDSPLILSRKGKTWRKLSFNPKKYRDAEGRIKTTMVCGSLENLVRGILKSAGLPGGSSHSGRRTLATWLDRRGHDLDVIQQILGHESSDMSLRYIEPWERRVETAFKTACLGLRLPEQAP